MRLGLRLREDRLPIHEVVALAALADERGFDTLFVPELDGREMFVQLGAFAGATRRMRLGPGIANIFTLAVAAGAGRGHLGPTLRRTGRRSAWARATSRS
ncbi:MAG: LLM class flavin-dependent oxidoreductase [Dehalococcoidia bacterium]